MNVVNMPFSEPARKSESKTSTLESEGSRSKDAQQATKFGQMVETDSQDDNLNNSEQETETSSQQSKDQKQDVNGKTQSASSKSAPTKKNGNVEEFLYGYQKSSAESSFQTPKYEVPRGFEDYAHPHLAEQIEPGAQIPQVAMGNIGAQVLGNSEQAQGTLSSSLTRGNIDSYSDLKTLFSNLNQNLAELESSENENIDEMAEKIVIPIPPVLNFLNHDFAHIEPKEIPSIVTQSPFLGTVLNADSLEGIMSQKVNTASVLASLGFSSSEVSALSQELGAYASPNEILDQLGFDHQQISAEISILKNNLQLEGLTPYMERAEELYNEVTAAETPSLTIDAKASKYTKTSQGRDSTTYIANPKDLTLVSDLNEILAKEQIEHQAEPYVEDTITPDSEISGGKIITSLKENVETIESDLQTLTPEDGRNADLSLQMDSQSDNNSMLESNSQAFEITGSDSTAERVELVKNIIDKARITLNGDLKTMQFNIKTENLGNINLAISSAENALQVSIKTDVEEARQTLATEMNNLQESLGSISNEIQSVEVNIEHDESWTQNQDNFFEKKERHEQQQSSRDGDGNEYVSEIIETTETVSNLGRRKSTSESSTLEVRV